MGMDDIYGNASSEFASDVMYGILGEEFFYKYRGKLLRSFVLPNTEKKVNRTEGMDYFVAQAGRDIIRTGGLEVKTFGDMSILRYGINGNDEVTLPFELFSCESGKKVPREKWSPYGWLRQMFHPEEYNKMRVEEGKPLRAVMPGTLAYLFCESKRKDEVHPFSCIAIENFCTAGRHDIKEDGMNDFVDDLKQYASKTLGLDLVKWDVPKATDEFWQKETIKKHVHENLWNVPFSVIKKHGKPIVTIIDEPPSESAIIAAVKPQYVKISIKRLHKLLEMGERTLNTKNEEKHINNCPEKVHPVELIMPDWMKPSPAEQKELEEDISFLESNNSNGK